MPNNTLQELRNEHGLRELRRLKLRLPILVATVAIAAVGLLPGILISLLGQQMLAVPIALVIGAVAAAIWYLVPQITVISPTGAILRYFYAILPSFPSMFQDV